MRFTLISVVSLSCMSVLFAQPPGFTDERNRPPQTLRELEDQVEKQQREDVTQAAEQREIEYQRLVFYNKAKKFVDAWTKFTRQLNEKQTVNVKLAKEVSKAFHDLEKSDGWPAHEGK